MLKLLDTHLYESGTSDSLRHLIVYLSRAVKYINYYIKTGDLGLAGTSNASEEDQMALDVLANKVIMDNLRLSRLVSHAASEEEEEEMIFQECGKKHEYSVAFDPLDGSSLIETNLAIGSIVGIYKGHGFLGRTGREQVGALYAVYGPRVTFVYSIGKGVHEFTLNEVGEFTLTRENMKLKDVAKYFGPGNLRAVTDNKKYKDLVDQWMMTNYTLRYSGGMVADINHIFMKGEGIFTYPPFPPKYPSGKLRLLFECNPFAYLAENCGGKAHNGAKNILDVKIEALHQRTPIYIGSKAEVEKAIKALK
jgi:fructose-1,6-bisphosphatase I